MKVGIYTLGCKVNQYESESIREELEHNNIEIVDPKDKADIYIINTCTVTNVADKKSRQYIRQMKRNNKNAIIIVTGCYAEVAKTEIEKLPEVDMVFGNEEKKDLAKRIVEQFSNHSSLDCEVSKESHVQLMDKMSRAYVKIEDGCDRFCSYCLVPYARGKIKSRPVDDIIREIKGILRNGYQEIVLTGINTALYGHEDENLPKLDALIDRINSVNGNFRIRLSSLEPTVVDSNNVKKLLGYEKLCAHLHLSAQSGSNFILERMNRNYTKDKYLEIVSALRCSNPLYGITTDIIVGFPGESEKDFMDTIDLVQKSEFAKAHIFKYSPRRFTKASSMKDQISAAEKNIRAKELKRIADMTAGNFCKKNIGHHHDVLIEKIEKGYMHGYSGNYIPTKIKAKNHDIKIGDIVTVEIKDSKDNLLIGELCERR